MPERADEQLQEVLKGLLNVDPDKRWTLEDMLDHPFCDTSAIRVDLTAVLANLNKMDQTKKSSLMKRYMEEEGADSDDEISSASTAEEDTDQLDVVREQAWNANGRPQDPGADKDEVQKRNDAIKRERRGSVFAASSADQTGCVIS